MDKYKRLWGKNKLFTKTGKRLFDIANANEIEYETKCALEKKNTEKKALLPGYIEHADKDLLLPFSVVLNITQLKKKNGEEINTDIGPTTSTAITDKETVDKEVENLHSNVSTKT